MVLTLALLSARVARAESPGIRWIDVGQGSAALVVGTAGEVVMIDSGPSAGAEVVVRALREHGIGRVQLWVHTHFDADHVGGVTRAVAGEDGLLGTFDDIEVAAFWDRGLDHAPSTAALTRYLELTGDRRHGVSRGARWVAEGLELEVVTGDPTATAETTPENARGIALCVRVAGVTLLAPGDLPAAAVAEAAARCHPVDVLWASHHGARDGTDSAVLATLDAGAIVIITAGMSNSYCHPDPGVLTLLLGHDVRMTGAAGVDPRADCASLITVLGAGHSIVAGDVWLPLTQNLPERDGAGESR